MKYHKLQPPDSQDQRTNASPRSYNRIRVNSRLHVAEVQDRTGLLREGKNTAAQGLSRTCRSILLLTLQMQVAGESHHYGPSMTHAGHLSAIHCGATLMSTLPDMAAHFEVLLDV